MDKDLKTLNVFLERQVKFLQKQILDLTEVTVPQTNWKALRSKLLGVTNDFRRDLQNELETNYKIKFDPKDLFEDVIEVKNGR